MLQKLSAHRENQAVATPIATALTQQLPASCFAQLAEEQLMAPTIKELLREVGNINIKRSRHFGAALVE